MSEKKQELLKYSASEIVNTKIVKKYYPKLKGDNITIAILDSGIDVESPVFNKERIKFYYDFSGQDNNVFNNNSHGNQVASIIAGRYKEYEGIAPNVNLIICKVMKDGENKIDINAAKEALNRIIKMVDTYNIKVVNLSWGTELTFKKESEFKELGISKEIEKLIELDVSIVVAIGNKEYTEGVGYPAAHPNVIGVGSLNAHSKIPDISDFSQYHPSAKLIEIYVESNPILTNTEKDEFKLEIGTSFAAPIISGFIAIAQQMSYERYQKYIPQKDMRDLLVSSAEIFMEINHPDSQIVSILNPIMREIIEKRNTVKPNIKFFGRRFVPIFFLSEVENYLNVWFEK